MVPPEIPPELIFPDMAMPDIQSTPPPNEPNICMLFVGIPYLVLDQAFKICIQGKKPGKFGAR